MNSNQRATTKMVMSIVIASLLAASPGRLAAATDMFLKLKDIPGESNDKKHGGEIEVLAWSWGLSQSRSARSGAGAGKVSFQDINFTKWVDTATTDLMIALASGKKVPSATFTVRKSGETKIEFYLIDLKNVVVKSLATGGSGGEDRFTENVGLGFEQIQVTYLAASNTVPGKPGDKSTFAWDLARNVEVKPRSLNSVPPAANQALEAELSQATPELLISAGSGSSQPILKATLTFDRPAGTATLAWNSVSGAQYEVLFGASLSSPLKSYLVVPSDGDGTTSLTVPIATAFGFFQVREAARSESQTELSR
jgi:type VI secretion system secreted protein Hcp